VAEKAKGLGYAIDWLVPENTFNFLFDKSKKRILVRGG